MKTDRKIVRALISFYRKKKAAGDTDLEFLPFIKNDPNAYLLGVIYNQGMSADYTWQIPQMLAERLGHFDIERIASENIETLEKIFYGRPALHRYWKTMAGHTWNAAKALVKDYEGSATNIWSGKPSVATLYKRLTDFKGIGPKKANMAIRALAISFEIPLADPHKIDLPVDIHVRRVFLRTGLAERDSANEMISIARKLNSALPAELDLPSWLVGRRWCHATKQDCQECVLAKMCRKKIEITPRGN